MAFREREVIGTLVDVDGEPVINAKISAVISTKLAYTASHIVIPRLINTTTDADGNFSMTIWCDEDSLIATSIIVGFPVANTGDPKSDTQATLDLFYEDGSPKEIGTLIAETLSLAPNDAQAFNNLVDTRIDQKGTPVSDYAMKFTPNQVWYAGFIDHNLCAEYMYTPSEALGNCWARFKFMVHPDNTQGVICDTGHGGNHAILLEAVSVGGGKFKLYGNMFNGVTNIEANSIDTFKANTWQVADYVVIGQYLYLYLNGVMTAKTNFTGTRTVGGNTLDGHLYIGASGDHQGGNIWVREASIFEQVNGFGIPFTTAPQAFTPQRVFTDKWRGVNSVFNIDLTKPANRIIDSSAGYDGSKNSVSRSIGTGLQIVEEAKLPQWEIKPFELPSFTDTPTPTPDDADWFDAFESNNLTLFTVDGQTAASSASISNRAMPTGQLWTGSAGGFPVSDVGILEGRAISTEADVNAAATGYGTLGVKNIRIDFNFGINTNGGSIYACRLDASNYVQLAFNSNHVDFYRVVAGSSTTINGGDFTANAATGFITRTNNTLSVTIGGQTYTLDVSALSTGFGFGIGVGALQRMKSFKVQAT